MADLQFRFKSVENRYWVTCGGEYNSWGKATKGIGWVEHRKGKWRANTPSEAVVGTTFRTRREAAEALFAQRYGHPELKKSGQS